MSETLHSFPVSTRRGHGLVVFLGTMAMLLLVAGVVTFFGAPPEIMPWKWPMMIAGAVFLVGAFVRHSQRRRTLEITKSGDQHFLICATEDVRLTFPLSFSGDQMTQRIKGIPMYEVWLKLVDAFGRGGVFLQETRGAIHGAQKDWLTGIDKAVACERFEAGSVGQLAEILARVKAVNAQSKPVEG